MKTKNKENILRSVTEKQHLIFRENTLKAFNRSRGVRKERMKIKNCQPGISLKRQVMLRVELGPFTKDLLESESSVPQNGALFGDGSL